jgi:hypothetical protein
VRDRNLRFAFNELRAIKDKEATYKHIELLNTRLFTIERPLKRTGQTAPTDFYVEVNGISKAVIILKR